MRPGFKASKGSRKHVERWRTIWRMSTDLINKCVAIFYKLGDPFLRSCGLCGEKYDY